MKLPTLKRAWLAALYQYLLCLAMTLALGIGASFAEESFAPYQSTFDDYRGIAADAQTARTLPDSSTVQEAQQATHDHSEQPHQHAEGGGYAH